MIYFSSLTNFLAMGGYATYVWFSYAIVMAVLLYQLMFVTGRLRNLLKKIRTKYVVKA